jgi:exodeoxyribonuclease VII small subunit
MASKSPKDPASMSFAEASAELDDIVEHFEEADIDVDDLIVRLERATALVAELDQRLRATKLKVEEIAPRLDQATASLSGASVDPDTGEVLDD